MAFTHRNSATVPSSVLEVCQQTIATPAKGADRTGPPRQRLAVDGARPGRRMARPRL